MLVASSEIECGHFQSLNFYGVTQHLQNVVKAVNPQCGDYYVEEKSSIRCFGELIKHMNKKEDEHENPQKISFRDSKGIQLEQHICITE